MSVIIAKIGCITLVKYNFLEMLLRKYRTMLKKLRESKVYNLKIVQKIGKIRFKFATDIASSPLK